MDQRIRDLVYWRKSDTGFPDTDPSPRDVAIKELSTEPSEWLVACLADLHHSPRDDRELIESGLFAALLARPDGFSLYVQKVGVSLPSVASAAGPHLHNGAKADAVINEIRRRLTAGLSLEPFSTLLSWCDSDAADQLRRELLQLRNDTSAGAIPGFRDLCDTAVSSLARRTGDTLAWTILEETPIRELSHVAMTVRATRGTPELFDELNRNYYAHSLYSRTEDSYRKRQNEDDRRQLLRVCAISIAARQANHATLERMVRLLRSDDDAVRDAAAEGLRQLTSVSGSLLASVWTVAFEAALEDKDVSLGRAYRWPKKTPAKGPAPLHALCHCLEVALSSRAAGQESIDLPGAERDVDSPKVPLELVISDRAVGRTFLNEVRNVSLDLGQGSRLRTLAAAIDTMCGSWAHDGGKVAETLGQAASRWLHEYRAIEPSGRIGAIERATTRRSWWRFW